MDFSPDHVHRYLEHKRGAAIALEDVTRFPRGTSRQTWFVRFRDIESGASQTLVFRCDHEAGSSDATPLDQEHFVYDRLARARLPVAKALWWEDDPRWTDQPFYVREHIAGDWRVEHLSDPDPRYDALRIEIAKEHLRKLAQVHKVDWRGLGFSERLSVPKTEADCGRTYVETIRRQFESIRIEAIPIFLEAAEWLIDHAPPAPCLCLCKGTNGLGEEVFRDGEIVALSDWEEVSIGDPAADFAFMQPFTADIIRDGKPVWTLSDALDYYRALSGIAVTPQAIQYYGVMRALRLLVTAHKSAIAVHASAKAGIRQAWTGTEVASITKRVLAGAMQWMPSLSPERFAELNVTVDTL